MTFISNEINFKGFLKKTRTRDNGFGEGKSWAASIEKQHNTNNNNNLQG
ncbi:hypothetical protein [Pedobacter sp. PACM 27299]|nr:hypothetical protein [Pedobacter sp. PACM 27299]